MFCHFAVCKQTRIRHCLTAVPIHLLLHSGSFVANFNSHFVALRTDEDGLWINQGHRTHEWQPVHLSAQHETALKYSHDLRTHLLNPQMIEGLFQLKADCVLVPEVFNRGALCFLVASRRAMNTVFPALEIAKPVARSSLTARRFSLYFL